VQSTIAAQLAAMLAAFGDNHHVQGMAMQANRVETNSAIGTWTSASPAPRPATLQLMSHIVASS
jgi:hypothetical protein